MKEDLSLPSSPSTDSENARRYSLRQMLGDCCCRCKQDLRGHRYQIFAVTVATTERHEALLDFFHLAKAHAWKSLARYQDFDGGKNAAEIYALRCPAGDLTALYVRDPVELYDSIELEEWDPLDEKGAQEWTSFLPESKWVAFDGSQI
jgi:hypothetical protein